MCLSAVVRLERLLCDLGHTSSSERRGRLRKRQQEEVYRDRSDDRHCTLDDKHPLP